MQVPVEQMVMNGRLLTGHLTGSVRDAEVAMGFAVGTGVRPLAEHMPVAQRNEAVQRLPGRAARFRIVDPLGQP